jgi:DNA-binding response OmpR family regulator
MESAPICSRPRAPAWKPHNGILRGVLKDSCDLLDLTTMGSGVIKGTVLVVDADKESRELIRLSLSAHKGAKLEEFDTSAAMHRYLDQQPWTWFPVCALVDLVLPAVSGYDVVRRLRARFTGKKIPIVIVSSLCGAEDILEAQVAGADAFVKKPFNKDVLLTAIEAALENQKKGPQERRYSIAHYL